MLRNALALLGVLLFITGIALLSVEISRQQAEMAELEGIRLIQLAEYRTAIMAGIGLLLGPILTIPWWLHRLRREAQWFEKRDEPVDGPPRVPN